MTLRIDAAAASLTGKRSANDDVCSITVPSAARLQDYGALIAIADGVGGLPAGDRAANAATEAFRASYYASPESWGLERALRISMEAANAAVLAAGEGGATTLSAAVLCNRRIGIAHVGDTRVWRYRAGALQLLTRDHQRPHRDIGTILTRACGFDETINCDITIEELAVGDLLLLTSDGIHGILNAATIAAAAVQAATAQLLVDALTQQALAQGSSDNVSACAVRIEALPPAIAADVTQTVGRLRIRAAPAVGATIDGFRIDALLHQGRMSTLFKATDLDANEVVALKFPNPQYADDASFVEGFLREEWIGRRIESAYVVKAFALPSGRRTQLYSALAYHEGETLAQRIKHKQGLSIRETLTLAAQLLTAVDHLHRKGVIHRDIKPENILIDAQHQLRLLDLGVSRIERFSDGHELLDVGTANYRAPELFQGKPASEASDVYAAGVTLYEMLTQRFPYGEIETFSHPKFSRAVSPERYNPEVPLWLSRIVLKACAAEPHARFAHAVDLQAALARPAPELSTRRSPPLLERISPQAWRALFFLSLLANLLLAIALAR